MKNEELQTEVSTSEAMPIQTEQEQMLHRIGHVTRSLHNNLVSSAGLNEILDKVASEAPNTRDRLNYVTKMTEQAAEKVLNATDKATPLQDELAEAAVKLEASLKDLLDKPAVKSEYCTKVNETIEFAQLTAKNTTETKELLMEIMMAQDFQDLTGQVIKKITELAHDLERQLVQVLVDFSPEIKKEPKKNDSLMNGPQINAETTENVVSNQEEVDDLLDSLGF